MASLTAEEEEARRERNEQRVENEHGITEAKLHAKKILKHRKFKVHMTFPSGTPEEDLQLVGRLVHEAGGEFTGAHIANQSTWQHTWASKLGEADRVIVFYTEPYRTFFSKALQWEHNNIVFMCRASPGDCGIFSLPYCRGYVEKPIFFADESLAANPDKLADWLRERPDSPERLEAADWKQAEFEHRHDQDLIDLKETIAKYEAENEAETGACSVPMSKLSEVAAMRKNTEQYKAVEEAKHLAKELRNDIYNLTDMDKYQEWHTWCANHNPGGSPGIEMCWNGEQAWAWAAQGAAFFSLTSLTACLFSKGGPGKGEKVAERPPLGVTSTDAVVTATPVFRFAVQTNDEEKVRELLKEGGDVNEADTFHMTAVHYAAQNGFKTILQDLIDAKANVNVKNKFGMDPIYMAAAMGWADCVDLLKAAGGEGEPYSTPEMEHLLREICSRRVLESFLPQVGVTPVASKLAKQCGNSGGLGLCAGPCMDQDPKIEHEVVPPEFRIEKVRELIGLGVDVSAPDPSNFENKGGKTALALAINKGHKEVAKLLIEAGADCTVCDFMAYSILDEAWTRSWQRRYQKGKTDEDDEIYDLIEEKGGTLIVRKQDEVYRIQRAAKE